MFFQTNLSCLKKRQSELAEWIESATVSDQFQLTAAKKRGFTLLYKNTPTGEFSNLTSLYDPFDESKKIVDSQWDSTAELVIVFGMAGFHHVEHVLERLSDEGKLLIIEPNLSLLKLIFQTVDLSRILQDPRVFFAYQQEPIDAAYFAAIFIHADNFTLPKLLFIEHPSYFAHFEPFFSECMKSIRDVYQLGFSNISTRLKFGNVWVRNILSNLNEILQQHDLQELKGALQGKPVILVSAGPSLNKNIALLAQAKGKAFLLCVDTALRALLKKGIRPDAVVAVDGSQANAKHFEGIEYSDIPLLVEMSCHKDIVKNHKGVKYFFSSGDDLLPWLTDILQDQLPQADLLGGGSVATMAFTIAMYMGAEELIFVGQDLSYPGGKLYAQGTQHENRSIDDLENDRKKIELTDIYGNPVFTTFDYLMYLNWFNQRLQKYTVDPSKKFINATEGGALREHVEIMTFQEVLQNHLVSNHSFDFISNDRAERFLSSHELIEQLPLLKVTAEQIDVIRQLAADCKRRLETFKEHSSIESDKLTMEVDYISSVHEQIIEFKLALKYLDAVGYRQIFSDIYLEAFPEDTVQDNLMHFVELQLEQALSFFGRLEEIAMIGLEIMNQHLGLQLEFALERAD